MGERLSRPEAMGGDPLANVKLAINKYGVNLRLSHAATEQGHAQNLMYAQRRNEQHNALDRLVAEVAAGDTSRLQKATIELIGLTRSQELAQMRQNRVDLTQVANLEMAINNKYDTYALQAQAGNLEVLQQFSQWADWVVQKCIVDDIV
jgi:hypothetical protein